MNGIVFVEATAVEATTGQMLVTFKSGGDAFRFHLPAHVALRFRQSVMPDPAAHKRVEAQRTDP